ncbi:MAG: hypothetical protein WCP93_01030 [Candidatus Berkelbacteria bacterium]
MSKHYTKSWLFRCADDRYGKNLELRNGLKAILNDADVKVAFGPMTPFGNSLGFTNQDFCNYLPSEIKTARHLGIEEIIFIDHLDCGAFSLTYGKLTAEEEEKKHLESIEVARRFFKQNAPDMKFVAYLQDFDNFKKIC